MTPTKYFPPLLIFLYPVVDPVFCTKMIANINTIDIVVVIIFDFQSQNCILVIELETGSKNEQIFVSKQLRHNTRVTLL